MPWVCQSVGELLKFKLLGEDRVDYDDDEAARLFGSEDVIVIVVRDGTWRMLIIVKQCTTSILVRDAVSVDCCIDQ